MIKRLLHMSLGYKVLITFANGKTEKANAYLSKDCTLRARVFGRQLRLQDNGVVRGMYPNDKTTWKAI